MAGRDKTNLMNVAPDRISTWWISKMAGHDKRLTSRILHRVEVLLVSSQPLLVSVMQVSLTMEFVRDPCVTEGAAAREETKVLRDQIQDGGP